MAKWVHLAWLVLLVGGCGGPPVGSKVPKASTNKMAVGAAAAATALTLANPNSAGRRPESAGEQEPKKVHKTGENVPAGVLDRVDAKSEGDDEDRCEPDEPKPDRESAEAPNTEMLPKVVNENREARDRERREKCSEQPEAEPEP